MNNQNTNLISFYMNIKQFRSLQDSVDYTAFLTTGRILNAIETVVYAGQQHLLTREDRIVDATKRIIIVLSRVVLEAERTIEHFYPRLKDKAYFEPFSNIYNAKSIDDLPVEIEIHRFNLEARDPEVFNELKKWDLQGERLIFPQNGEHLLRYKLKEIDTYLELDKLAQIAERHGNEVFIEVYQTLIHFAGIYNHAAIHLLRTLGKQFDLPNPEYNHFHRQHVKPVGWKVIED